ncbi:MAG: hypothetical protein HY548_01205 [Elusimicrobia bacterium]|nr:hypothetical protein [Elusimicrobiota bacterium]
MQKQIPRDFSLIASLLLLVAMGFIQLLALPNGFVGKEHDDALYLLAAEALRNGHYHLWFLPGGVPITQTTPGFPLLLLPAVFGLKDAFSLYPIYVWGLLAACNAAVWLWFRRRFPWGISWAATALFAMNPLVLSRSGVVMPEAPFLLAALILFLCWDRWPAWATGIGILFCYLIRPAGLPLAAAFAAACMARKKRRDTLVVLSVTLLGIGAWMAWTRQAGGMQEANELLGSYGGGQWTGLGKIAVINFKKLVETWGATFLPMDLTGGRAPMIVGGALLILATAGLVKSIPRIITAPEDSFIAITLVMHLFWPWWFDRYLLPLLPFLILKALQGVPARWPGAFPRRTGAVLALLVLFQFFAQGRFWLKKDPAEGRPTLADTYSWIRSNTSPADIFASPFYARDLLYADRLFLPLPPSPGNVFHRELARRKVRFVLWEDVSDVGLSMGENAPVLAELRRVENRLSDPARFRPVHVDGNRAGTLYEVLRRGEGDDSSER